MGLVAEGLKFDCGISLKGVIKARMVFSVACAPHLAGGTGTFQTFELKLIGLSLGRLSVEIMVF